MPRVLAIRDIKSEHVRNRRPKGDGSNSAGRHFEFFKATAERPHDPSAFLVEFGAGGSLRSHFHTVDQFQVLVSGEGLFGRHHLKPYSVHYSRAYTPYGPLLSEPGWAFLTLRAGYDPGSQRDLSKLKDITGRNPWQVTRKVDFAEANGAIVEQPMPEIVDDRGLFASTIALPPHTQWVSPDPAAGGGQYIIAMKGSLIHNDYEHVALALAYLEPDERSLRIKAGAEGLQALVLNFPRRAERQPRAPASRPATGMDQWRCPLCGFIYDESAGQPADGIAAGTRWNDVAEDWNCPDCSAAKSDFARVP